MARKRGNNEGCISRRKDGSWCAVVTAGRNPETGKPRRVFYYGRTRQEVADKLNQALADLRQGTFVAPSRMTVGEWLDTWLNEYKKKELRPTVWEAYEVIARRHLKPAIGSLPLKALRPEHLQKLYNQKDAEGLSPATVRHIHQVIHGALDQAVKNQLVLRNVSEATNLPRARKKEVRALTPEEQKRFLEAVAEDRLGPQG